MSLQHQLHIKSYKVRIQAKHLRQYCYATDPITIDVMVMLNCFCGIIERHLALFPAGTIVRDPHHRESSTRREQDLNLCIMS